MEFQTFEFKGHKHNIGDENCPRCWLRYQKKCKCGGILHAEFHDEDYDRITHEETVYIKKRCDKCGKESDYQI